MEPQNNSLKNILILVGFVVVVGTLLAGLVSYLFVSAISAPKTAAKEFLETAIAGDVAGAHATTSADFKEVTSEDDLGLFIEGYPVLADNTRIRFTNISIVNNLAVVYGTIEGGGATSPITVNLIKEDGEWRVLNLSLEAEDVPLDDNGF